MLVYIREGRPVVQVSTAAKTDFEGLALRDERSGVRYIFLYRAGAKALHELKEWLAEELAKASGGPTAIVGDLNVDTAKPHPGPASVYNFLRAPSTDRGSDSGHATNTPRGWNGRTMAPRSTISGARSPADAYR